MLKNLILKAINLLQDVVRDTMKEIRPDGTTKWSYLRVTGFLWFWIVLIPYTFYTVSHGRPIDDNVLYLTGLFFLGVVGGKGIEGAKDVFNNYVTQKATSLSVNIGGKDEDRK